MSLQEELKKLDYKGIGILLIIGLVLGVIYGAFFINNIFFGIVAMVIAVFGSYFVLSSFFEEDKPEKLEPGEKMILRTMDRAYILFPKKGGFLTAQSERDLSVYLTDRRIFAKKSSEKVIFEKNISALSRVSTEKRMLTKYLRLRYYLEGKEKDALLFVGDTDIWIRRLGELGVKEKDAYESDKEEDNSFVEDATSLKSKVMKKK
ncbi:MAG: hypothetical protein WAX07_10880 [Candidatus Altiarchaeia archaeon]